jgi:Cullin, a subunit of E3 ubiquitin ligase
MCLEIETDSAVRKAETDIICYKRLKSTDSGELESPFQHARYVLGKTYKLLWFTGSNYWMRPKKFRFRLPSKIANVHQGFHFYQTLDCAKMLASSWENIVKCRIPKGTRYIMDENDIVALKFEPVEIVQHATEKY